jgi:UDP-N-acetylmuramate dehydrogenase
MNGYRVDTAIAEGVGYTLVENASLEGRNTFRVPARAGLLIEVRDANALQELAKYPALSSDALLVLGEGSNILFAGDFPGTVLSIATRGIEFVERTDNGARVRAAAGESWNDFVQWSLAHGFVGLENLIMIPGTVGAAPIQNIGAYGTEVGEFIAKVIAWDRLEQRAVELSHRECAFAYRDSIFKRDAGRWLVTAVEFELPTQRPLRMDYAGIAEELETLGAKVPTARLVAEAIARLRTRKLPNPAVMGNAGSFFKNPVVDAQKAERLKRDHPMMAMWPTPDGAKISAAWLIEACGMKGYREGDAGISAQHALVLVNHGKASGADLLRVARSVAAKVKDRFDIRLEAEPRIVGQPVARD